MLNKESKLIVTKKKTKVYLFSLICILISALICLSQSVSARSLSGAVSSDTLDELDFSMAS